MQIGFIGCGHMGTPMVENLLRADHEVMVYDINTAALAPLAEQGAVIAESIKKLAQTCAVIFTMLQTGEQVRDVCLDVDGIFNNCGKDCLVIDCSSIAVKDSRYLHEVAVKQDVAMLDAPVSGGVMGAVAATLTIMVGGDAETFQRAQPIFAVLGKNIIHTGGPGNGQAAKLCNNMILGISMIGISEAFNLASQLGLDAETLFAVSSKSSGQCWALTSYAPVPNVVPSSPANNNFEAGFAGKMMLRDLRLSQLAAAETMTYTPLGQHATELYQQFVDGGAAEQDFSAIINMLREI